MKEYFLYLAPPIISVLFGYYLFHRYKRYILRKKLRIGFSSEIGIMVKELKNLNSLNQKVGYLPADSISFETTFYEENMNNLQYLSDGEIKKIIEVYSFKDKIDREFSSMSNIEDQTEEKQRKKVQEAKIEYLDNLTDGVFQALFSIQMAMRIEEDSLLNWSTLDEITSTSPLTMTSEDVFAFMDAKDEDLPGGKVNIL